MRSPLRRLLLLLATLALPVLVAIHAPLSLLAANKTEVLASEALRSLGLLTLAALLLTVVLAGLFRDLAKGALAAAVVLLVTLSYGHLYNILKPVQIAGVLIGRHRFLLPAGLAVIGVGLIALARSRKALGPVVARLSLAAAAVLSVTVLPVVRYASRQADVAPASAEVFTRDPANPEASAEELPDIYYIILDAHGRADTLRAVYRYDNTAFLDSLRRLGFYVADRSMSNYSQTALSLASTLNMTYLTELAESMGADSDDRRPAERMLNDSQVVRLAKDLGYRIVVYEAAAGFESLENADVTLAPTFDENRQEFALLSGLSLSPFEGMLLETTIGRVLFDFHVQRQNRLTPLYSDFHYQKHRQRILYQFESLPQIAEDPAPTFTFVHVMAPHPPFVFGAHGEEVPNAEAFSLQDVGCCSKRAYIEGYAAQIVFIDKLVEQTMAEILETSPELPIILLQGDHGPGANLDWRAPTDLGRLERMSILNAYLVPEHCRPELYPEISPVNSFRVVLGSCLGQAYPLLADESLFSTYWRPYDFVRVENEQLE